MPPEQAPAGPAPRRRGWLKAAVLLLVLCGGLAGILWRNHVPLPEGVSREQYQAASRRFTERFQRTPDRMDVFTLLGEEAGMEHRFEAAVVCFREIPTEHPRYGLNARLQEGFFELQLKQAAGAERNFREYLRVAQDDPSVPESDLVTAYKWLSFLLSVELRLQERKPILAEMHRRGLADVLDSKQFFFPHLLLLNSALGRSRLDDFLEQDPGNVRLRVASARYLTLAGRLDESMALLEELHRAVPEDRSVIAALLECCFEQDDWSHCTGVAVPDYNVDEPWLLTQMRAQRALEEQRWQEAARYFEAVLAEDPSNSICTMGLARAAAALGQTERHQELLRRSLVISEIRVSLVGITEEDPEAASRLAEACDSIGLTEAAEVFRGHAERIRRRISGVSPSEP